MGENAPDPFDTPPRSVPDGSPQDGAEFRLDVDGFEGPIDLLLSLAREQKVDLARISIVALADQYLAYVAQARALQLDVAAEYLVMAAWLAYLKSRLLLPDPEPEGEEAPAEMLADALAFQMRRLEAMQEAARSLMALPQLGRDVFVRGRAEGLTVVARATWGGTLPELLRAYGAISRRRAKETVFAIEETRLMSIEAAIDRLGRMLGTLGDWRTLTSLLPGGYADGIERRSATAATFVAALEMAKSGRLALRQEGAFGPIFVRAHERRDEEEAP